MGYVYKGTIRDTPAPAPKKTGRAPYDPDKCGTYAGYKQHQSHETKPCRPCKDAAAKYRRELTARHKLGRTERGFQPDKCGTLTGFTRHARHGVPACEPCKQAKKQYRRDYYYERAAA
jgi:hypothetical protein